MLTGTLWWLQLSSCDNAREAAKAAGKGIKSYRNGVTRLRFTLCLALLSKLTLHPSLAVFENCNLGC